MVAAGLVRGASEFPNAHEVLLSEFYGKHIGDDLSGYGERRPFCVPSLSFSLIKRRPFVAVSKSQFRGLYENFLDVLVPLFGNGHSNQLVRGASLRDAEPTTADDLLDRLQARNIADLKSPGERSDLPNAGDGPQPLQPRGQQRVSFQGMSRGTVEPLRWSHDLSAQLQERRILSFTSSVHDISSMK